MTKDELVKHIKVNKPDYNSAVIISALFKRIYGELPKIGLSGFQGEGANNLEKSINIK